MAIRAQKHALLRLDPQLVQSDGDSLGVDLTALLRWIHMMEVQRSHVVVVSAYAAAAARLLHEDRLDLPASARNCCGSA
jgi:hypothetical protein